MKKVIDGARVTFSFDGLDPVVFDATKASSANRAYAEMHGWQARIGDNAALSQKDPKTGIVTKITEALRRTEVESLVTFYETGTAEWRVGAKPAPLNPVFVKMAEAKGVSYAEAMAEYNNRLMAEMQALIDAGK